MTKTCKNCGYLITQWGHIKNWPKWEQELAIEYIEALNYMKGGQDDRKNNKLRRV